MTRILQWDILKIKQHRMTNHLSIMTEYEYDVLNGLRKVTHATGTTDDAVTEFNYDTHTGERT